MVLIPVAPRKAGQELHGADGERVVRGVQHKKVELPVETQELQCIVRAAGAVQPVCDSGKGRTLLDGRARRRAATDQPLELAADLDYEKLLVGVNWRHLDTAARQDGD